MCLTVSKLRHPDNKPIILKKDLDCYKGLDRFKGRWVTPYKGARIKFNIKGFCIQKCFFLGLHADDDYKRIYVEEGIHSIRNRDSEVVCADKFLPAIIPAGSEMYYGYYWDLVSTNLIIFRNSFYKWLYKKGYLKINL